MIPLSLNSIIKSLAKRKKEKQEHDLKNNTINLCDLTGSGGITSSANKMISLMKDIRIRNEIIYMLPFSLKQT